MKQCHRCSNKKVEENLLFCPVCGTAVFAGTVLDKKYYLDALIGEGGMGQVYRATHTKIEKQFAVKILLPAVVAAEKSAAERFLNEAKLLASFDHENIISITDFGTAEETGLVYLVMEYLKGKTLKTLVEEKGRLDYRDALWILERVCDAMSAVHAKGIVHRDLKPHNIFLTKNERGEISVKALDFGIALKDNNRYTKTGQLIGSIEYMSPEHCNDKELDARSDIYTLGVDLYEMLTGRVPFQESDKGPTELLFQHIFQQPRPLHDYRPDIPPAIEKTVLRALEKNPEDRQQSALELADELRAALISGGITPIESVEQSDHSLLDINNALSDGVGNRENAADIAVKSGGKTESTLIMKPPQNAYKSGAQGSAKAAATETSSVAASSKVDEVAPNSVSNSVPKRTGLAAAAYVAIVGVLGISGWLFAGRYSTNSNNSIPSKTAFPTAPSEARTRTVSYWGELRQYRKNRQIGQATRLTGGIAGETYFGTGDGLKFFVKSSDDGSFYLINEEAAVDGQPPKLNILFPSPKANDGASKVAANAQASTSECLFDAKAGTEKVWIVWSANPISELDEAARRWANKADEGFIKDQRQAEAVLKFLTGSTAIKLQIEPDEANESINLIAKGDLIVYLLKLKHR